MKIHNNLLNVFLLTHGVIVAATTAASVVDMDQQRQPDVGVEEADGYPNNYLLRRQAHRTSISERKKRLYSWNDRSSRFRQTQVNEEVPNPTMAPTTAAPTVTADPTISSAPTVSAEPTASPTITSKPTITSAPTVTATPTDGPTPESTAEPTRDPTPEPTKGGVQLNDIICVEGYIMDWFCIERGTLLDNPSIRALEGPEEHTVHCLVDVGICYNSWYEVLVTPLVLNEERGTMEYQRGWRIYETDDYQTGKQQVIDLGRQTGTSCSTCTGEGDLRKGFRAAIRGRLVEFASGDTPALIDVIDVEASHGTSDPCALFFNLPQQEILN
jgi:hypothetical protein